jgi:hypothetical protein
VAAGDIKPETLSEAIRQYDLGPRPEPPYVDIAREST